MGLTDKQQRTGVQPSRENRTVAQPGASSDGAFRTAKGGAERLQKARKTAPTLRRPADEGAPDVGKYRAGG